MKAGLLTVIGILLLPIAAIAVVIYYKRKQVPVVWPTSAAQQKPAPSVEAGVYVPSQQGNAAQQVAQGAGIVAATAAAGAKVAGVLGGIGGAGAVPTGATVAAESAATASTTAAGAGGAEAAGTSAGASAAGGAALPIIGAGIAIASVAVIAYAVFGGKSEEQLRQEAIAAGEKDFADRNRAAYEKALLAGPVGSDAYYAVINANAVQTVTAVSPAVIAKAGNKGGRIVTEY